MIEKTGCRDAGGYCAYPSCNCNVPLRREQKTQPDGVKTVIFCPTCTALHIDKGEWAEKIHKTHLCEVCGHQWQPFEFATFGVDLPIDPRIHACVKACEGITTHGLESFISPPEGSLGLPHGSWAGQLRALWDELQKCQHYRDLTFDGYKILQNLTDKAKQRTSGENVADVLDALHAVAKKEGKE